MKTQKYVFADKGKLYHYRLLSTFLSFFTGIAVSFKKHLRRIKKALQLTIKL